MCGFLFSFLLLTGCASVDYADYRQTALVLSDPPGARVYDGERFIGVTPNYMRFRRGRQPKLVLVNPDGERRQVELKTHYRWADSFGMNALLLPLAPLGWGVDWATGTAWEAADPPIQVFGVGGRWPESRRPAKVAVAPPQGVDFDTATALGMAIDEKLRRESKFIVDDFAETAPSFQFYRSYAGLSPDKGNRYRLLSHLKVDHVLISTAEQQGGSFLVKAQLTDVITGATTREYSWRITPGNQTLRDEFTAQTFFSRYFQLLPNTVFLNFANYSPTVAVDRRNYGGKEAPSHGVGENLARYLSALSLGGLERHNYNTRGHFVFSLVPTAIVSRKAIVFPGLGPVADTEFRRWYLSGGYGFEGGYMGRFGLVYADLIPMLTWSSIRYQTPDATDTLSRFSVQAMLEVGYSYFFSNHLIGRVYYRSVGEDSRLWNQALTRAGGSPTHVDSVSSGFTGFSVGYYIPTTTKRRKGWLFR